MSRLLSLALTAVVLTASACAHAATGRVIKVLPFLLDREGRRMLAPSLYQRDAYQAFLLAHPKQQSGMLFKVQWKTRGTPSAALKLRIELRGVAQGNLPKLRVLEKPVERTGWFSRWTGVEMTGEEFKDFGQVTAWRVTLWEGENVIGHQQSFLW